ncbi:T5orf172 domain-containing protein [Luteibacter rhizovicinus]|uniref:T5orf172 domain-containing protein n=1 Tax=Luteibacter rhizovicinus TaxID=242606 RepID=A0A4R3YYC4_9GAMM|nr:GIY-YIG nuclease family protein [Luteibacter rhizovicinus]TCV97761.1 T5orf172 domain-containing protein [Luteibacter rhizovicinus]
MNEEALYPRFASRGCTFVYVLPCRDEDILKVGFSRDPMDRFRTLHRRFFEFFDLERGLLIRTDHLRDARSIERLFITTFATCRASAPLVVPRSAAGYTEWFRGVSPQAEALARRVCEEQGFILHAPLSAWVRGRLGEWSELLFGWSTRMLEMIEYQHFNTPPRERSRGVERALREVLDAYVALDVNIETLVPVSVLEWYRSDDYFASR